MHPSVHAASSPDKPAVIVAETGETISYAELDAASNRAAQLFRSHGLKHDDVVAFMLENTPHYYGLTWGAQRAGLRYVCISSRLTQDETDYILENSGAKMLVVSASLASAALQLETRIERYSMGGAIDGWPRIEDALAAMPATRIADERAGVDMLYSSGTTGRPKGVKVPLPEEEEIDAPNSLVMLASAAFGINADSIYLSPAPLYHAAPLRWSMTIHRLGGTVVLMKKFDPEAALAAIQHYHCNAAQFVPTHFVRMLKLPAEVRAQYDVSSMKSAIHAAAPCPVPVKQAMIDWWGPVLLEYYAGSEGNGMTFATSQDWLAHKGTVGRAILGTVHIVGEDNETEVPVGEEGAVFFESDNVFEYHDDPEKTASSRNSKGWSTLGDVGKLDADGFLYLTDRKSFMIISGGVNIYPQEIENHLVTHPRVADVAVVGGPHEEMGEEVIAVIQPADMADATDEFRDELGAYARQKLSGVKVPRRIDFMEALPRHDTGKLYKRLLRDQYWEKKA
ncbi:MAG: acyl-CoA synthetase [Sphingopyxis terrae]|uniref:Acyl-CoA synthetase n=1 Tax=Sphingopyxis terrae subsp. terrae NBRC 15098 TaxID=1219058 RepID=A0A142VWI1_9SPHN|nr:acyl-CoA synthetase [Sphingopyxis terrae]AMU94156.1 acyl-CoA synthetase [Sphingopyxis terrae subsp. terrae NBRC 15098]MBU7589720.1 acyl-CoA synthetase [Sphingopyxis terrae]QXF10990.1 acyl-CoA synthetase [Sphingopyxis terrae subsp. terrae]